jgi:hypothetical protein
LFEWARYHLALGFKVVIYDRDGAHKQDLFKEYNRKYRGGSESGKSKIKIILNWDNLIYHDFTILEMINVTRNTASFNNTEHGYANRCILIIQPDKIRKACACMYVFMVSYVLKFIKSHCK